MKRPTGLKYNIKIKNKAWFPKRNIPSPETEFKKGQRISPNTEFKSETMRGKNNPRWKGGITPKNVKIINSIQARLWREAVFARDNWTCQKCKKRGSIRLNPHHIQNFNQYPQLRFAIDNGITFCQSCHKEFHKIYGKKNNTKKQIKEFLKL